MQDTDRSPRSRIDELPAQPISTEVLLEKYAKGSERTIADVNLRVARALAQAEPAAQRAQWEARFAEALQAFGAQVTYGDNWIEAAPPAPTDVTGTPPRKHRSRRSPVAG